MAPGEILLSRSVLDSLPDPILILTHTSEIEFANHAFLEMIGYTLDEIIQTNIVHYISDPSIMQECSAMLEAEGRCVDQETYFRHKDGHDILTIKNVNLVEQDDRVRIFVNIRNMSELDSLNKALSLSHENATRKANELSAKVNRQKHVLDRAQTQLEEVLNCIHEIIWYIDDETLEVKYVSSAVEDVFGISIQSFKDDPNIWLDMVSLDDLPRVKEFFACLQADTTQSIDFRIRRPDGSIRWLNSRVTHHAQFNYFIGVTNDVTEVKHKEELIVHMAYHDHLTDLPNRRSLQKRIAVQLEKEPGAKLALLFLDLDNFKYINDAMGHEIGDEILKQAAIRLRESLNEPCYCSRFGGDEFIMLVSDYKEIEEVNTNARNLLASLAEPFSVKEREYFLTASIGISLYPENADNGTNLIRHADTAMYHAKRLAKNQFAYYSPSMDKQLNDFVRIESLMREGLANNHFELHFQPLIRTEERELEGFEALLRFQHPKAGYISPADFIPVAEATGDIIELGYFVIKEACKFAQRLVSHTDNRLFVSINVSAKQFSDKMFVERLLESVQEYGVDPHMLKLELTESIVMDDIAYAITQLDHLKATGFHIALDDFGTGYSSFSQLAKLPIDTLKIDKSFVIDLFRTSHNRHIIEAITNLAHVMEMNVIAEGVESHEHADYLHEQGVDMLQGFLISKAMPAEQVIEKLNSKEGFFRLSEPTPYTI